MKRLTNDITAIPVSQVKPDPGQPRENFTGIEELAASIVTDGLNQPITVKITGDDQFTVVTGERRYQAHVLAGLDTVDCIVVESTSMNDLLLAQLRENIARESMLPSEEAAGIARAIQRGHHPHDLAQTLGKSTRYVDELMAIGSLPKNMQAAVDNKTLPKAVALELAKNDPAKAKTLYAKIRNTTGVRQMKANLKAATNAAKGKKTNVDGDPAAKAAGQALDALRRATKKFQHHDTRIATLARTRKAAELTAFVTELRTISNAIEATLTEAQAVVNQ